MRILLIDDHVALQRGLRELLATEFPDMQIECANTEASALQALETGHWHIAVVDLDLPGKGGLELIPALKRCRPLLKVLVYTMHSEQQFGIRALRAGADGYVTKDTPPEDLFLAIRQLLSGRKYLSIQLADQLASAVTADFESEPHQRLSSREYAVFHGLAQGRSLTEIAAALRVNIKTVSTYRARVFEKLQITNHAELIRYAMRQGLTR